MAVDRALPVAFERRRYARAFGDQPRAYAHAAARFDHVALFAVGGVAGHGDFADTNRIEPLDQAQPRVPVQLVADAVIAFAECAVDEFDAFGRGCALLEHVVVPVRGIDQPFARFVPGFVVLSHV